MMVTDGFDIRRTIIYEGDFVPPLLYPKLISLQDAALDPDLRVITTTVDGVTLVFNLLHLVYYHAIQGSLNGKPWLVSFCLICHTGTCFSPQIGDRTYHFGEGGLYNAMTLLRDQETGSLWNHLTGECVHGEMIGHQLTHLNTLRHSTVGQVMNGHPEALFISSQLDETQRTEAMTWWQDFHTLNRPEFDQETVASMGKEDPRLPRLEAGLGIWSKSTARFYPYTTIHAGDNVLVDRFDGRSLVIMIDAGSTNPLAFFTTATHAEWRGEKLVLDNGDVVREGNLYNASDELVKMELPFQHFQRWYSFAFTFPNGEIYRR